MTSLGHIWLCPFRNYSFTSFKSKIGYSTCHSFCFWSGSDDSRGTNSFESHDDFERRIFGDDGFGSSSKSNAFYQKLERAEKAHDRSGFSSKFNLGNRSEFLDGLDDSFSSLSDGMDAKLKKEATYFEFDPDEIAKDDYCFRPDVHFQKWQTYDTKVWDRVARHLSAGGVCYHSCFNLFAWLLMH